MKKLLVILFILICGKVYSQTPVDSNYIKLLYYKGEKEYQSGEYDKAKEKLVKFISIPIPRNDTIITFHPGYKWIEMKNKATVYLKNIYFANNDYGNALLYHNLQKTIYRKMWFGCGNGMDYIIYPDLLFAARCYEGVDNIDSAIISILPYVGYPDSIISNIFTPYFVSLNLKKHSREDFKKYFQESLEYPIVIEYYFMLKIFNYYLYGYIDLRNVMDKPENGIYNYGNFFKQDYSIVRTKIAQEYKNTKLYKLIMEN